MSLIQRKIMGKLAYFLIFLSLVERSSAGVTPKALGVACSGTSQCTASDSNSECDTGNTGVCICTANYVEESTVCKVKVDGSTACANTAECPSNAACSSQCSCNSGYTTSSFLCTAVVGMTCASTSQCTAVLANTVCSSLQCACTSGSTGTTCTDPVIGMVCANDADCQNVLSNTVCTSLQCACAAGFSGSVCSSADAIKLSRTTTIPIATILLAVIYKCLI